MTATPEIIAALNQSYGSAVSKACLAAMAEGEGGTTFNILFGGSMWTGSLAAFPVWPGVQLSGGSMTHAAGAWQFEPLSYADAAKISGRSSFEPQDQIQNAWDYAAQIFGAKMPAMALHAALLNGGGYLLMIPTYLGKIWPGGCDSGFPKRFANNLPLVTALMPPALIDQSDVAVMP